MKKIFLLICLLLFAMEVSAHRGNTAEAGGHINHSTGEYHYHHGYPEHQHTNGICPYNYVNAGDDNYRNKESDKTSTGIVKSKTDSASKDIKSIKKPLWYVRQY